MQNAIILKSDEEIKKRNLRESLSVAPSCKRQHYPTPPLPFYSPALSPIRQSSVVIKLEAFGNQKTDK